MTAQHTLISTLPSGILRWLLRLPITLYHLRLGWVLGERFVLLNHIGRKSGQVHQTVVEIIGHNATHDDYYIVSGWGYKSNWYQNLLATPTIAIQVGRRKLTVRAETLAPADGAQIIVDYRKNHPLAAQELSRIMGVNLMDTSAENLEQIVRESLPVVVLHSRIEQP